MYRFVYQRNNAVHLNSLCNKGLRDYIVHHLTKIVQNLIRYIKVFYKKITAFLLIKTDKNLTDFENIEYIKLIQVRYIAYVIF